MFRLNRHRSTVHEVGLAQCLGDSLELMERSSWTRDVSRATETGTHYRRSNELCLFWTWDDDSREGGKNVLDEMYSFGKM